jgi:hypothetical protein
MKRSAWIVCERTGRWAAALRTSLAGQYNWASLAVDERARSTPTISSDRRVYEVRSLAELTSRLQERPAAVALVETHAANLTRVLHWLSDARDRHADARFIALLDSSLVTGERAPERGPVECNEVTDALLEAGAAEVAESPRYLQNALALARQHWAPSHDVPPFSTPQPLVEWARSLLPWQD